MCVSAVPHVDDVVVRPADGPGGTVYAVSRAAGPAQIYLRTRHEAVAQAITFARLAGIRAWFAQGPSDFILLVVYTPEASPVRAAAAFDPA